MQSLYAHRRTATLLVLLYTLLLSCWAPSAVFAADTLDVLDVEAKKTVSTRIWAGAGPTCALSDDGTRCFCWWLGSTTPSSGSTQTVASDDPAFFVALPTGIGASRFLSVNVASDIWLVTDAGDVVVIVGRLATSLTDATPGSSTAAAPVWAVGVIFGGESPILSVAPHPVPTTGADRNSDVAGVAGRREVCFLRLEGHMACHVLQLDGSGWDGSAGTRTDLGNWISAGGGSGYYNMSAVLTPATTICGSGASEACRYNGVPLFQVRILDI